MRCILFLILFIPEWNINAQDAHYWTQQYGTKSMLLSNSVIGGVSDLGAVFYNPARLSQVENPSFLISADVYEFNQVKVKNAFGKDKGASQSDFGGLPSLTAGTFKIGGWEKQKFAYAVLSRRNGDIDVGTSNETNGDLFPEYPGNEYFNGEINLISKFKEHWAMLAWSYAITEHLSVGASGVMAAYNNNKKNDIELNALNASGDVAFYKFLRESKYESYSVLFKLGVSSTWGKALWGVTLTTPGLQVYNKGSFKYKEFYSHFNSQTPQPDLYTTSNQSGLDIRHRTPIAVGAGLTVPYHRTKLHLSAEWYGAVKQYTVMQASDFISQNNLDTLSFKLIDELEQVLNVGFGTEWYLNSKFSMFFSASTDFSAVPDQVVFFTSNQSVSSNATFTANLFNVGFGIVIDFPNADITLGSTYTGGTQKLARPINFPDGDGENIFDPNQTASLQWSRWRIVFSFSVPLLEKKVEKWIDNVKPGKQ